MYFFFNSIYFSIKIIVVGKLLISGILSSIFLILALYTSFLTTLFFIKSLSSLKSTGTGTNLSTSNYSNLLFKLLKLLGTSFNLSISNLSTLDLKLAKSIFLGNFGASIAVAYFKSVFVAYSHKSNLTFTLPPNDFGSGKHSFFYAMSFLSIQLLKKRSWPFHLIYTLSLCVFITLSTSLQFFFAKRCNNFFVFKMTNNICLWNSIFKFCDKKIFFRAIWKIAFCKNIFIF